MNKYFSAQLKPTLFHYQRLVMCKLYLDHEWDECSSVWAALLLTLLSLLHSAAAHTAALQHDSLQCVAGLQFFAPAPDREAIIIITCSCPPAGLGFSPNILTFIFQQGQCRGGSCGRNNIIHLFTEDADFFTSWTTPLHDIFWMSFYIL